MHGNPGKGRQAAAEAERGWHARLLLHFKHDTERSYLAFRSHHGPLRVQRPFYPEGERGACHVYLLHPPGGLVGGDELAINIEVASRAHALLTTPAAAKFYRSAGQFAVQRQHLAIEAHGVLEWLPQENIVFNGARACTLTSIYLQQQAHFIGWDISCLGRTGAGEPFKSGEYRTQFEIWREEKPLFVERGHFFGDSELLTARWGMAGNSVLATLVCVGNIPDLVETVRKSVSETNDLLAGASMVTVSQLNDVLVCRYLGQHAEEAKAYLSKALEVIRPALLGCQFVRPRIWDT